MSSMHYNHAKRNARLAKRPPLLYALVDCNNFYASCERLFNPKLIDKPIVVLSNNDGCVIARSNESKALGIQMCDPYFKIAKLCQQNKVAVFSSNFALYGDISNRVMMTLEQFCPDIEIYSIDEAFLRIDKIGFADAFEYAVLIRKTILKNIGIPVSIGIAKTKTLAKVASHVAKSLRLSNEVCDTNALHGSLRGSGRDGVCDLRNAEIKNTILKAFPVGSLWGVGRQSTDKLHELNIKTAEQLCNTPTPYLRKKFGVTMERVILELNNISCLTLSEIKPKQNITCSRSFAKPITELQGLCEAISHYAARACEKARGDKLKAQGIIVYIRTSPFNKTDSYYANNATQLLLHPSNDTMIITEIAQVIIKRIYKSGFEYKKAGIILCDLASEDIDQNDLFCAPQNHDNESVMQVLDRINHRYGSHSIFLAAEGNARLAKGPIKSPLKSPSYTSNWGELKIVSAY